MIFSPFQPDPIHAQDAPHLGVTFLATQLKDYYDVSASRFQFSIVAMS
jgi:hypothetical protein